jgi:hypothetical protein
MIVLLKLVAFSRYFRILLLTSQFKL